MVFGQESMHFETPNSIYNEGSGREIKSFAYTAGDYLQEAGTLQLFGVGLSLAGTAVILIDSKSKESNKTLVGVGIMSAISGFVCSIYAPVMIIKAGKALNEERKISLHPSSEGIGLALKF